MAYKDQVGGNTYKQHVARPFFFYLILFGFLTKIRANPNQIIELKNFSNPNQICEYFGFDFFKSNTLPLEYLEVFDAASATGLKQRQFIDQSVLLALDVLLSEFETRRT